MESSFMEAFRYSLQVYPLREDTHFSGFDSDRAFLCWVYYETRDEQAVARAWNSVGVDLTLGEREVVDPDTSIVNEQSLIRNSAQACFLNVHQWEVVKQGHREKEYKDGPLWP
uniref:Uncharacterized protein n=1 Tax=Zooxanthella nutricula TaxID=1333877 RepID=A0A7S2IGH1_9DINO|mmetsp:Transcript_17546/g.52412  ORF Transcript_17546/g.52412 Transcript_17546/m.52412 type:complete len:113 (+) Transcript_17546:133-471(+)